MFTRGLSRATVKVLRGPSSFWMLKRKISLYQPGSKGLLHFLVYIPFFTSLQPLSQSYLLFWLYCLPSSLIKPLWLHWTTQILHNSLSISRALTPSAKSLFITHACSVTESCPTLCAPWTLARQAPLSMGFPRQEYWSGLPFPPPVDLSHPGIQPVSPTLAGRFFTTEPPGKPPLLS